MEFIQSLLPNECGRDFVVGDIHGSFSVLEDALAAVQFDAGKDRLIATGDLINKGAESEKAFSFLKKEWFYAVRGNHENAIIELLGYAIDGSWDSSDTGTAEIYKAYWLIEKLSQIEPSIINKMPEWLSGAEAVIKDPPLTNGLFLDMHSQLSQLPYVIEIGDDERRASAVLHAETPLGMDWPRYKGELINSLKGGDDIFTCVHRQTLCGRSRIRSSNKRYVSGIKRIFAGHSTVPKPLKLGNVYYTDTGVYKGNFLCIVEVSAPDFDIKRPKLVSPNYRVY